MRTANTLWGTQLLILGFVIFLALNEIGTPTREAGGVMIILWAFAFLAFAAPDIGRAYQMVLGTRTDSGEEP